ncbi:MAG: carboxyl transferase domain-containing protein, partial [Pseudomonadota bacterium]
MSRFRSQIRVQSEQYQQHRKDMLLLIDQLLELNARGAAISARREAVFRKRNQLMPRERLARLLDPAMPWLAIGNLAGYLLDSDDEATSIPGGTCITGIGFIGGVRCVVVVDDSGIMAGSLTKAGGYRVMRAQQVSLEQKLPFVHLVESAGGDLVNYRVEGFTEGGRLFGNQALLSKAGIPVISVLHGSATAGGAYMPGLSDYVVAVKGRGRAFLAGPPLLKAATGEIASEAELGGATMHAEQSGLVDYLVDDDSQAMLLTREIISRLDWNGSPQTVRQADAAPPHYDPEEIAGIIPIDYRQPYDMRELVARIVDGSDITEFKPRFGVATVCLHAQLFGETCGILGNNGPIDPDGAVKAAQFLQLCDQSGTPVI